MNTEGLAVLVQAMASGSLSAASRRLGVTPIVASRRLAALERTLGVRLVNRTTRSISLTAEGEDFLPHAREMLEREALAVAALHPGAEGVSGLLRATAPAVLGREIIIPMLAPLLETHPNLRIELQLTERMVDLVGEGLDLAVRIADLKDSSLVARRVGTVRRILVASPDYLARRGRPSTTADLAAHECLTLLGARHWLFDTPTGLERVRVSGRLASDAIDGLHAACRSGLGIAMLSDRSTRDDLETRRLVSLPLDAAPHAPPISAIYPAARTVAPKVRLFLRALSDALAQ